LCRSFFFGIDESAIQLEEHFFDAALAKLLRWNQERHGDDSEMEEINGAKRNIAFLTRNVF
jgi:hypothetical protein